MTIYHQLLAILVTFIWGTNFVFIRYGLDELPPFTFATLRFCLVLIPLVFFISRPKASWKALASYGILIGFGQFGLLFWAMQDNITPGLASLIIQLQIIFTILLSLFFFDERLNRWQMFSLVVCLAGLIVVITYTDGQTTLLGLAVTLIAALSWASGNLVVKTVGKVDIIAFIVWSSMFSIPPLALMAWFLEGNEQILQSIMSASWQAWCVIVWQSIGNTMIGYGLWNMLLSEYKAVIVTPWALLIPVFGMSASAFLLSEPLFWWKLLSMSLILAGIAINMYSSKR